MFTYNAEVHRIVDGDTVYLKVDLGFRMTTIQGFRLAGIDTPEIRGVERPDGLKSKDELARLIEGKKLIVKTGKTGKFGRWIATIYIEESMYDVNDHLLREGFAEPYK